MYLDAVSNISDTTETNYESTAAVRCENDEVLSPEIFSPWKTWPVSEISHHGSVCCESAREWLVAMDFSQLGGESIYTGPRWLNNMFRWGASRFPIYWCQAVRKKHLDCGALAALAYEVLRARGVKTLRTQMAQRFSARSIEQWRTHWGSDCDLDWTSDDLIYHEGCAVFTENGELKIWDSSAGWWVNASASDGYGALLAIRISDRKLTKCEKLDWQGHELKPFVWNALIS